jgi:hypothetical protein
MHKITLHVAQIVNIEQLQQHPRNMVRFRHTIVNTLHKGANKHIMIITIIIITTTTTTTTKSKSIYGQFYRDLERPSVDKEKSLTWLSSSGLKAEDFHNSSSKPYTLSMHYHQRNIMKQTPDGKCRMCYSR